MAECRPSAYGCVQAFVLGGGTLLVLDSQVFRRALNQRVTTVSGYQLSSPLSGSGVVASVVLFPLSTGFPKLN